MSSLQVFAETAPYNWQDNFTSADTTTAKVLFPTRDTLARVDYILMSNSDSVAHSLTVTIATANGTGVLGTAQVPANAGTPPNKPFDVLTALLPTTTVGLALNAGDTVHGAMTVTLGGGITINFVALGGRL